MNKKIYFNDKFLELAEDDLQSASNQSIKFFDLTEFNKKELKKIVDEFIDNKSNRSFVLKIENFETFFYRFKSLFYYIEAAGGLIEKNRELLFIHRHGRWDLPKGKLEKGEGIEEAAIRECEEECGVMNLTIKKQLPSTFHIYAYKNGYALKQSYWFYMQTDYNGKLTPQLEENIDEVKWFPKNKLSEVVEDTYFTIRDVVKSFFDLNI